LQKSGLSDYSPYAVAAMASIAALGDQKEAAHRVR
jgi:hypothetical protein